MKSFNNPVNFVREVTLIEVFAVVGEGTDEDPVRYSTQYWTKEGKLLAKHDTMEDE